MVGFDDGRAATRPPGGGDVGTGPACGGVGAGRHDLPDDPEEALMSALRQIQRAAA